MSTETKGKRTPVFFYVLFETYENSIEKNIIRNTICKSSFTASRNVDIKDGKSVSRCFAEWIAERQNEISLKQHTEVVVVTNCYFNIG
ncbi:MAG: hypothetical protein LBK47_02545 [Prevotellaceae bacterium]|jgi:hypothetical protein|nr:hypothetical protein [Prevotellaceae bacterium]